jgi:Meiotically up-regulated gene 113
MRVTREHILTEIQRTAEANGGAPLGKGTFSRETGIKPSDWGKYWARWGDAIREAGLEPNRLQGAFDEGMLLAKYAQFVRELGRIPTSSEMRLHSHTDPEFPGRAIEARFVTKARLLKRVVEHFSNQGEFEDVVLLCQQAIPAATSLQPNTPDTPKDINGDVGYVYLAKSGRFYKIGRTNAAGRREYEIGILLPEKLSTVHIISTDDPTGIEAYWHKRFEGKRKKGEWFQLTAEDVSAFKRRKFM